MSDSSTDAPPIDGGEDGDLAAELEAARASYERARADVREVGETDLERLAAAHRNLLVILDRYESSATGTGDFGSYLSFQSELASLVEDLPEIPHRERFERVADDLEKRRLREADFEAARERLSTIEERVALLDERDAARERYHDLRRRARQRIRTLEARIDEHERLLDLGEADLDAPVSALRDPVDAYDEAVTDAFESFLEGVSTREAFDFLETTERYPLVPFESPPGDLVDYVESHAAGREPIPKLLAYAGYSRSKLDHYVEDASALKRAVSTRRTYLEGIDAAPLRIGWPPPPTSELRWRVRELIPVADRIATGEAIEPLRRVRAIARDEDRYERIRRAALARETLNADQRRRIESGAVERDLSAARAERDRLESLLD